MAVREGEVVGHKPMSHPAPIPTEQHPAHGYVSEADVVVSHADYWVDEEDNHVIVSTEFDLMGQGISLDEAVHQFYFNAEDLMDYFRSRIAEGQATDVQHRIFLLLSERFDRIRRAQDRELEEITKLPLPQRLKRRQRTPRTFAPSERQRTSSEPVSV